MGLCCLGNFNGILLCILFLHQFNVPVGGWEISCTVYHFSQSYSLNTIRAFKLKFASLLLNLS